MPRMRKKNNNSIVGGVNKLLGGLTSSMQSGGTSRRTSRRRSNLRRRFRGRRNFGIGGVNAPVALHTSNFASSGRRIAHPESSKDLVGVFTVAAGQKPAGSLITAIPFTPSAFPRMSVLGQAFNKWKPTNATLHVSSQSPSSTSGGYTVAWIQDADDLYGDLRSAENLLETVTSVPGSITKKWWEEAFVKTPQFAKEELYTSADSEPRFYCPGGWMIVSTGPPTQDMQIHVELEWHCNFLDPIKDRTVVVPQPVPEEIDGIFTAGVTFYRPDSTNIPRGLVGVGYYEGVDVIASPPNVLGTEIELGTVVGFSGPGITILSGDGGVQGVDNTNFIRWQILPNADGQPIKVFCAVSRNALGEFVSRVPTETGATAGNNVIEKGATWTVERVNNPQPVLESLNAITPAVTSLTQSGIMSSSRVNPRLSSVLSKMNSHRQSQMLHNQLSTQLAALALRPVQGKSTLLAKLMGFPQKSVVSTLPFETLNTKRGDKAVTPTPVVDKTADPKPRTSIGKGGVEDTSD